MKFSVNWLHEFIELPSSVEELAELLTLAGIEIEGIEKRGAKFDKVIVAQITASSQHPNADRLSVCQVDDGSRQTRQVVCGAKNYKVGDKVPLALPGAVLAHDLKIEPSKLRGVESQGMLCSPSELGLSEESDGLLILSPDAKIAEPIASLFPEDTILDVEITPQPTAGRFAVRFPGGTPLPRSEAARLLGRFVISPTHVFTGVLLTS